jgi:hypothetical protein
VVSAVDGDMLRAEPGPLGQQVLRVVRDAGAVHEKEPGDGPDQAQHVQLVLDPRGRAV